jgi:cephalosporin-C deacetylase-like acetyl esterase
MRQLIFLAFLVVAPIVNSQASHNSAGMTQQHLHELIQEVGSDVVVAGNIVQFAFDGADMLYISDIAADRMRIISPIVEITTVDREQLLLALMANFHSALAARHSIEKI